MKTKASTIKVTLLCMLFSSLAKVSAQTPELVKDINVGSGSSQPQFLTLFDNHLYFGTASYSGLWKTDGTESGTVLAEGVATIGTDYAATLGVFQDKLYFNTFSSPAFWSTTGGIDQAIVIKDQLTSLGGLPYFSPELNQDILVFAGRDHTAPGFQSKLYRSDMTTVGTVSFGGFISDNNSPTPNLIGAVNNNFLFSATETGEGREIYLTQGTTDSTGLLKDIKPGLVSGISNVSGSQAATLGNTFYFPGYKDMGQGLWKTDGTTDGTEEVDDMTVEYSNPNYLNKLEDSLYFFADGAAPPNQLFRINVNDDEATPLTSRMFFSDEACNSYDSMAFNGELYFPFADYGAGCELWKTDGTLAGTTQVKDINEGDNLHSHPTFLAVFDDWLYFVALKEGLGFELWKTRGFESNTVLAADINPGSGSSISNPQAVVFNDELYFIATDGEHGIELFKIKSESIFTDGFEEPLL